MHILRWRSPPSLMVFNNEVTLVFSFDSLGATLDEACSTIPFPFPFWLAGFFWIGLGEPASKITKALAFVFPPRDSKLRYFLLGFRRNDPWPSRERI